MRERAREKEAVEGIYNLEGWEGRVEAREGMVDSVL